MKKFEYTFPALGTTCMITIIGESEKGLKSIINQSYKKIIDFENEFSRFKENSLLSLLNKYKKLEVTDEFLILLSQCKEIYNMTHGYFNPLLDVRIIWYTNSFEVWDFKKLEISPSLDLNRVRNFGNLLELQENMNIDFWSIAKGYLSQKISQFITQKWYKNHLVNLGGDICISGKNLEWNNWKIALQSPFSLKENLDVLELTNMSISTSGTYIRNWKIGKQTFHHILSPYTSNQEKQLISVTILDTYGYKSDALATACLAMWLQKALIFCQKHKVSYVFILSDGSVLKK